MLLAAGLAVAVLRMNVPPCSIIALLSVVRRVGVVLGYRAVMLGCHAKAGRNAPERLDRYGQD